MIYGLKQVEEMRVDLDKVYRGVSAAETRAAVAEASISEKLLFCSNINLIFWRIMLFSLIKQSFYQ